MGEHLSDDEEVIDFDSWSDDVEVPEELRTDEPEVDGFRPELVRTPKQRKQKYNDSKAEMMRHLSVERRIEGKPSPAEYLDAAEVWLDMEAGNLGNKKKWTFPPSVGDVSKKEVLLRIGWPKERIHRIPNRTWLDSDLFKTYLSVVRTYREAVALPQTWKSHEVLQVIGRETLILAFARIMEARQGLREISDRTLFDFVGKLQRLLAEIHGDIETAGVSVNIIQENLGNVEDPQRQQEILDRLAASLASQQAERAEVLGLPAPGDGS